MYPGMMHSTCYQEMSDLQDFLEDVIPDEEAPQLTV